MSGSRFSRLAALLLLVTAAPALADDEHTSMPMPASYIEECGSCHVPYPARGLPASSWRTLMGSLDRHFGSDASLDEALQRQIDTWLTSNAGRRAADPQQPLRITRTAWYLHEHDEVPARLWRSPAVGSASNCGACHRSAGQGRYSEHDVRLPRGGESPGPSRPQQRLQGTY